MKKRIVSILTALTLVMCAGVLTACDAGTDAPGKDKETQSDESQKNEESQKSEEAESSEISEVVPEKIVVSIPEGFVKTEENGTITYAKADTGSNIVLNQTQYILENGDVYEFVTYTDMTFEGFTEVFNNSQASITFEEVSQ